MSEQPREKYYAHTTDGPKEGWEPMADHQQRVAELATVFLTRIHPDLGVWGDLLGRWHDIGKYSEEFQAYLESASGEDVHQSEIRGRVDHSTAAAQLVNNTESPFRRSRRIAAYRVAPARLAAGRGPKRFSKNLGHRFDHFFA